MCEKQERQDPLVMADEVCRLLRKNLQKQCPAASALEMTTLPFYVRCLKEALLYRSTELAATAIDLYRRNRLVSVATITRSLLETTALFNRLNESCDKIVKRHTRSSYCKDNIKELDNDIRRISLGTTDTSNTETRPNSVEPFEVPAIVRSLGTRFNFDAYGAYTSLCQETHPNFQGCLGAFTEWNNKEHYVEFIQDYHHMQEDAAYFQTLLATILSIVEKLEVEMAGLLPKFTETCEEYEKNKGIKATSRVGNSGRPGGNR